MSHVSFCQLNFFLFSTLLIYLFTWSPNKCHSMGTQQLKISHSNADGPHTGWRQFPSAASCHVMKTFKLEWLQHKRPSHFVTFFHLIHFPTRCFLIYNVSLCVWILWKSSAFGPLHHRSQLFCCVLFELYHFAEKRRPLTSKFFMWSDLNTSNSD